MVKKLLGGGEAVVTEELLTLDELALRLRLTRRTIYRLLKKGDIPAVRVGRKWRFDADTINSWLRQGMQRPRLRVLVIDDDVLITSLFKDTMREQGHSVILANYGGTGVEYVKVMDFDMVFLDLKMPGKSGVQVLEQIRQVKPNQPVTIITGYPDSEMMASALKLGPVGLMSKPFGPSQIIAVLSSLTRAAERLSIR